MANDIFNLDGQTAMITGGGTGLGRQMATALAGAGCNIIVAARRVEKLEETVRSVEARGGRCVAIPLDITERESVDSAFERCATLAMPNIIVNNAGFAADDMLIDLSEEDWDTVLDTNLKGAWMVAQAAARQMASEKVDGSIINISSVLATSVQKGTGAYAAAKAGLAHLTRAMALEWARYGIRINTIAPGYYRTDMAEEYLNSEVGKQVLKRIPLRRLGETENLDGPLLLLASKASSYMTGSVVTVDGGLSLSIV